jgi:hypothetical protein
MQQRCISAVAYFCVWFVRVGACVCAELPYTCYVLCIAYIQRIVKKLFFWSGNLKKLFKWTVIWICPLELIIIWINKWNIFRNAVIGKFRGSLSLYSSFNAANGKFGCLEVPVLFYSCCNWKSHLTAFKSAYPRNRFEKYLRVTKRLSTVLSASWPLENRWKTRNWPSVIMEIWVHASSIVFWCLFMSHRRHVDASGVYPIDATSTPQASTP